MKLKINGKEVEVNEPDDTPLLWVLRDSLGLTGAKYGCGIGQCGACLFHLDGTGTRACITPIADCVGRKVTTIEGAAGPIFEELRAAWIETNVVQCGYCQPAQILAATTLLTVVRNPTDADIDQAMSGVACRCGTYPRIRAAIHRAAKALNS